MKRAAQTTQSASKVQTNYLVLGYELIVVHESAGLEVQNVTVMKRVG